MFTSLPASKAAPSRSGGEAAFSVAFHLALLATALWLTSSRVALVLPARATAVYYVAPQPVAPPPALPSTASPPLMAPPSISVPLDAPVSLPPIDVAPPSTIAPHFVVGPISPRIDAGAPTIEHPAGSAYDAAFVDTPVALLARQPLPRYPETLRSAGVEGHVSARFVVDTLGRVEPASIEISETTHTLFADAVRAALLRQRFLPAVAGGRLVRQLVVQPFEFRIRS